MNSSEPKSQPPVFRRHQVVWDASTIQRIWDYYSASPVERTIYFGATAGPHVARTIKRLGLLRRARTIVDFSCGTGHLIEHCIPKLRRDARITGVDQSPRSIRETNERNQSARQFVTAVQFADFPLALHDGYADLVLLTEVIEHLDDRYLAATLQECHRILAPGGVLFITTPNDEPLDHQTTMCPECGCVFHRWQHVRAWTRAQIATTLAGYGFADVVIKTITWGNEWIDLAFTIMRLKKTGIYVMARRPRAS